MLTTRLSPIYIQASCSCSRNCNCFVDSLGFRGIMLTEGYTGGVCEKLYVSSSSYSCVVGACLSLLCALCSRLDFILERGQKVVHIFRRLEKTIEFMTGSRIMYSIFWLFSSIKRHSDDIE